jgi:glycine dehydrogenase
MSFVNFDDRHIGPRDNELPGMLQKVGVGSMDELIDKTIPKAIRLETPLRLPEAMSEYEYLNHIRRIGSKNKMFRSFIGQGYYGVAPLSVVIRNVLENPSWYTSYTPYQAEISQGRLEALLNFQTVIMDLTGMEIANASLLDESTAAAEAMIMMFNARSRQAVKSGANKFFVDNDIFLQTLDVITTRSRPLGIELIVGEFNTAVLDESFFGAFVQYPSASGQIKDYEEFAGQVHGAGALLGMGCRYCHRIKPEAWTPYGLWWSPCRLLRNQG